MGLFSSNNNDEPVQSGTGRLRRKSQSRRSSTQLDDSPAPAASDSRRYSQPLPPVSKLAYRRDSALVGEMNQQQYYQGGGQPTPQQRQQYDGAQQQHPSSYPASPPLAGGTGPVGGYRDSPPPHSNSPQYGQEPQGQQQRYSGAPPPRDQFQQRPESQSMPNRANPAGGRPMSYMGGGGGGPGFYQGGHQQSFSQGGQPQHAPSSSQQHYSSGPTSASRSESNHSPAPSQQSSSYRSPTATTQPSSVPGNLNEGLPRPSGGAPPPIRRGSASSASLGGQQQQPPQPRAPSTIAGEPLHDLGRAVGLLKSSKFYAEGESSLF
ncbi:hypothetical protein BCR35DRAFT_97212 [Leucosporidium creatinivorum]|uniref:Uncharacterized protein n=1 Tax=Leucosporidium creatinivorum TaxID=106004 RepID=A0A1Y2F760_9BASI|nr:hypothetical protein BCR35DRAFT_97212 [Leucosporidium creatinivorum]